MCISESFAQPPPTVLHPPSVPPPGYICTTSYLHTHRFNVPLSRTSWVSRYRKVKPIWNLLKQETVSGSGISRAGTRRNIHPLTPTLIIKHPLSVSSIYYFPWHPPCSFYVFDINITKKVYCINVGKNGTAGLTNTHQTLLCTFAMSLASIIVLITRQWCLLTTRCVTSRLIKKLNALSNQAQGWNLKRRWLLSGRGYSVMTEWNGSFDEMSMQQRFGKISGIWAHRSMHCCKTQKLWPTGSAETLRSAEQSGGTDFLLLEQQV